MSLTDLIKKSLEYKVPQERIENQEKARLSFINKFPKDEIINLSIDEYAQGTDENSFCYWLEFKKILFGIGGGNASKFGIYKAKADGNYYTSFGNNKRQLTGTELEDLFLEIKKGITLALEYAENDEIDKIKTIDIPVWNMVLQKILALYYPNKFVNIGASRVLIKCAKDLNIEGVELKPENLIEINYTIRQTIDNQSEFKDWPYEKIGKFLWKTYSIDTTQNYYIIGSKYDGKIDKYPEMLKNEVVSIAFANHLDLSNLYLETPSNIITYLKEEGEQSKSYNALKHFLSLKEGDKIAVKSSGSPKGNEGFLSIHALAEVVEREGEVYTYEPDGLGHCINVKFADNPQYKEYDLGGYGSTIHKLSKKSHIKMIFEDDNSSNGIMSFNEIKDQIEPSILNNYIKYLRLLLSELEIQPNDKRVVFSIQNESLNFIVGQRYCFNLSPKDSKGLYFVMTKEKLRDNSLPFGGTAPQPFYTYLDEFSPNDDEWNNFLTASEEELLKTKKSGFLKYNNQDFENFVFPMENQTQPQFHKMNFPLNSILYGPPGTGKTYTTVLKAASIIENREITSYDEALEIFNANLHKRIEFVTFHQNYSYEDFIQGLRPDTEDDKQLTFEKKDGVFKNIADKALKNIQASKKPLVLKKSFEDTFNLFFTPLTEGEVEEIEVKMKKVSYFITAITNKSIEFRKASGGTSHTLSINTLRKMYEAESVLDIQGLSSYYAPLLEKLLKAGKDSTGKKEIVEKKNYVIIIDEINRANISRVFGELITLIEPDKRSEGSIPLSATLPSGDTFMVPSNLYIIGTMNTADKSIALLDIALRRRFEFIPMYPKYNEDGVEVKDEEILRSINESIISEKGHDFQIGHSYFMDSNEDPYDLEKRMNLKVIPLMLEYFMNDFKTVGDILNTALKDTEYHIDTKLWPLKLSKVND
ncbi:AAA family ATPase [Weeksellaceae bacterium KMM 9713]|uniref:AAA family ATPase n=1 Tax=Profundicola chukchiensis TaxID=2961959 RepID=A0A9X4N0W6_9FLAO|nr:AAA family ATPase [Profundicola chukchiensis]MDG4946406.1 AAA family ATPase [Profundicola chukchiensis]